MQVFGPLFKLLGRCPLLEADHVVKGLILVLIQKEVFQRLFISWLGSSLGLLPAEPLVLLFALVRFEVFLLEYFITPSQVETLIEVLNALQVLYLELRKRLRLFHHLVQPDQVVSRKL